jgi:protoporphyrinogen/coproporphyrinogen III oxidase
MTRFVVIGGGVSGLAAARVLAGASPVSEAAAGATVGAGASVVLLEASPALGGKVSTGSFAGGPVEMGPDQFLRRDPSAERLCRLLGLGDDLVPPGAGSAAVFAGSRPRQLPAGLVLGVPTDLDALSASGIVHEDAIEHARGDAARDGPVLDAADVGLDASDDLGRERSAGELLRRRLGDEIVDRLVDPLLGGINAGSVDYLSLGTVAPHIARQLVGHWDVIAPLAAMSPPAGARMAGDPAAGDPAAGDPAAGAAAGGAAAGGARVAGAVSESPFLGVVGGLGRLVAGLGDELDQLGCDVRLGCSALSVASDESGTGYVVATSRGPLTTDGVVLAVPADIAAALLQDIAPETAQLLGGISYASVAVVTFAFDRDLPSALEGWTGVLVPRLEGAVATAVTLLSQKWPWVTAGCAARSLVRVSAGRYLDERIATMSDADLAAALAGELAHFTGITGAPIDWHVRRWPRSFPQYEPGHAARVRRSVRALRELPGIELAGALLGGIGVPACITSGERAAVAMSRSLGGVR